MNGHDYICLYISYCKQLYYCKCNQRIYVHAKYVYDNSELYQTLFKITLRTCKRDYMISEITIIREYGEF